MATSAYAQRRVASASSSGPAPTARARRSGALPGLRPGRLDRHRVGQRVGAGVAGGAGRERGRVQGPAGGGLAGRRVVAQLGAGGQGGQPAGPARSVLLGGPAEVGHRRGPGVVVHRRPATDQRGQRAHAVGVPVRWADGDAGQVDRDGAGQGGQRAGPAGGGAARRARWRQPGELGRPAGTWRTGSAARSGARPAGPRSRAGPGPARPPAGARCPAPSAGRPRPAGARTGAPRAGTAR